MEKWDTVATYHSAVIRMCNEEHRVASGYAFHRLPLLALILRYPNISFHNIVVYNNLDNIKVRSVLL